MTKRMSATSFLKIKEMFGVDEFFKLSIPADMWFLFRGRTYGKFKNTNRQYGQELAEILDWLDENSTSPYYPRVSDNRVSSESYVEFYFVEQIDAISFKLMFGEKVVKN